VSERRSHENRKDTSAHIPASQALLEKRRLPRQDRARFTVAAILEAAVEVIDDVGWAKASTNRIAERAGVSIGSLYQYFRNKETILSSLVEQHRQQVHTVVGRSLEELGNPSVPFEIALRRLFDDLLRVHHDDPALARVLSTAVPHYPAKENEGEPDQLIAHLQHILEHRPDVSVCDATAAAHVLAVTTEALTRWLAHEAPPTLESSRLIDEMVAMLSGYVTDTANLADPGR